MSEQKECPEGKVWNPKTNRCINYDGAAYRKWAKTGTFGEEEKTRVMKEEAAPTKKPGPKKKSAKKAAPKKAPAKKKCEKGKVWNPKTNRCIKYDGAVYRKWAKTGTFGEEEKARVMETSGRGRKPAPKKAPAKKKAPARKAAPKKAPAKGAARKKSPPRARSPRRRTPSPRRRTPSPRRRTPSPRRRTPPSKSPTQPPLSEKHFQSILADKFDLPVTRVNQIFADHDQDHFETAVAVRNEALSGLDSISKIKRDLKKIFGKDGVLWTDIKFDSGLLDLLEKQQRNTPDVPSDDFYTYATLTNGILREYSRRRQS